MLKPWLAGAWLACTAAPALAAESGRLPPVEIHGPTVCLACIDWADHLRQHGFTATFIGTDDVAAVKRRLKVPTELESVHTAVVAGYFIEGHVPATDVKRLLVEKPDAKGLVLPGMPMGSPGMEMPDGHAEPYTVELVRRDGTTAAFAAH